MKTKPIIIIALAIIALVAAFLIVHLKKADKPQITEVRQFLTKFNKIIADGNIDSVNSCFWFRGKSASLEKLIQYLPTVGESDRFPMEVKLNVQAAEILKDNKGLIQVKVPLTLIYKSFPPKQSVLVLGIRKVDKVHFKIFEAEIRQFIKDYTEYIRFENKDELLKQIASFDTITLSALKTARQLKLKYDSVLFFQHAGNNTYYFVIRGQLNKYFWWPNDAKENNDEVSTYKMGLVGPDLKEIIPPQYDLLHNIGGTIDGLIEVEKSDKRGLFDLKGKEVVPVQYEQVVPLNDPDNAALLRKGDDLFYLKKDLTITDKLIGVNIADIVPKIKHLSESFTLNNAGKREILEYNDTTADNSIIISPSYLVDMQLQPKFILLQNTLRHTDKEDNDTDSEDGDDDMIYYKAIYQNYVKNDAGWFNNIYFNIFTKNHYQITEKKSIIVIDKRHNKLLGITVRDVSDFAEEKDENRKPDNFNENTFKQINDTLFEFKTNGYMNVPLANPGTGPTYYYIKLMEGKLTDITNGWFSFTRYVKLDDSYLKGCYDIGGKPTQYPEGNWVAWMLVEMFIRYDDKVEDKYGVLDKHNAAAIKIYNEKFSDIERYNVEWLKKRIEQMKLSK